MEEPSSNRSFIISRFRNAADEWSEIAPCLTLLRLLQRRRQIRHSVAPLPLDGNRGLLRPGTLDHLPHLGRALIDENGTDGQQDQRPRLKRQLDLPGDEEPAHQAAGPRRGLDLRPDPRRKPGTRLDRSQAMERFDRLLKMGPLLPAGRTDGEVSLQLCSSHAAQAAVTQIRESSTCVMTVHRSLSDTAVAALSAPSAPGGGETELCRAQG